MLKIFERLAEIPGGMWKRTGHPLYGCECPRMGNYLFEENSTEADPYSHQE
jgi:hypothetical protein